MAKSNQSAAQGYAPPSIQVSDWQTGEQLGYAGSGQNYNRSGDTTIDLQCAAALRHRKIYAWIFAAPSSGGYTLQCSINFLFNKSPVGRLPLAIAQSPSQGQSVPTLFASTSQYSSADTIQLYPVNPVYGQPALILLQPLYIYGVFDEVKVNADFVQNITDFRIWLGVLSSP